MIKVLPVLLLVACASTGAGTSPGPRASDYYPLRTGVTWVYKGKFLGVDETRTVVMGPKDDSGFFKDDAGARFTYDGEGLRDETRYLLKQPLTAGAKWQSVAALGAIEKYEIKSVHQPCKVAAGSFPDCIEIKSELPVEQEKKLVALQVYAKGVGLVRLETAILQGELKTPQVEMELVQFRE